MVYIPLFTWFYTSQVVVWDFFHQQYLTLTNQPGKLLNADQTIGKPLGFWVGNTAKHHGENTSFGVAVVGCGVVSWWSTGPSVVWIPIWDSLMKGMKGILRGYVPTTRGPKTTRAPNHRIFVSALSARIT